MCPSLASGFTLTSQLRSPQQVRRVSRSALTAAARGTGKQMSGSRAESLCHFFDSIVSSSSPVRADPSEQRVSQWAKAPLLATDRSVSHCGLDTASTHAPIGLMVASKIDFRRSVSYPEPVIAGLSIAKLGKTSVTYRVGVWAAHVATEPRFKSPPAEWHGLEPVNDVRRSLTAPS